MSNSWGITRENTTDGQRESQEDDIILIVRNALVDDEPNVRLAAARAFDVLQEHFGSKAIDQTLPSLLEAFQQLEKDQEQHYKRLEKPWRWVRSVYLQIVSYCNSIPRFGHHPCNQFSSRLCYYHQWRCLTPRHLRLLLLWQETLWVNICLQYSVKVREGESDKELQSAVDEALRALLASVSDIEGLNTLLVILLGWYIISFSLFEKT